MPACKGRNMAGPIKPNETVTFGKTGSIKEFDPYGFDLSEYSLSWTQEDVAGFSVIIGSMPPDAILRLHVAVMPFIQAGHINRQQFFVFVNGIYVGFRTLAVYQEVEFVLPRHVLSPRGLRVEFVIPTASSPKSLGISQDVRKLGIALSGVSFALQK
jgi:hypothetical protein